MRPLKHIGIFLFVGAILFTSSYAFAADTRPEITGVYTESSGGSGFANISTPGTVQAERVLVNLGSAAAPSLAIGDGNTGFYEVADNQMRIVLGGLTKWQFAGETFWPGVTGRATISRLAPTDTVPVFFPASDDADTGIGRAGTDQLSFIAGAVEGFRITETGSEIVITFDTQATAPATCSIGDFYVDTSGAYCACGATNTWSNMIATGTCS